jgi:cytochrome c
MTEFPVNIHWTPFSGYGFLRYLLVFLFIIHIFFVGLMIGGTYWSVIFRVLRRMDPFYGRLAKETLFTVTVNKNIAAALGVGPMILISVIYTMYWLPAVKITYSYFFALIWFLPLAFLFMYLYRFTWDTLGNRRPLIHLSFGLLGLLMLTVIPFVFLTDINLMLLPYRWKDTYNFFDAIVLRNVFQRYCHFMVSAFATTGLFAAAYFRFRGRKSDDPFYKRATMVGLKWALVWTLLQSIFGPINFYSLQYGSYSTSFMVLVLIGVGLAVAVCLALVLALLNPAGKTIALALVLAGITAFVMGFVRDRVRVNMLRGPNMVAFRNINLYQTDRQAYDKAHKLLEERKTGYVETGQKVFQQHCTSCHAEGKVLVGPPLTYMVNKYQDKEQQMMDYVLNPVKVNPKFPAMPKPSIDRQQAQEVVQYILGENWKENGPTPS